MNIALLQSPFLVGDAEGNAARLLDWIDRLTPQLKRLGTTVLVSPELSLCGYSPRDWLLHKHRWSACPDLLAQMSARLPEGIALLVGYPAYEAGVCYNAAALLTRAAGHRVVYRKQVLPHTGVFDEYRYFQPGQAPGICVLPTGERLLIAICEDMWSEAWCTRMRGLAYDYIVVMNASPYDREKYARRVEAAQRCVHLLQAPLAYCNSVGIQDEWIFDGRSFFMSSEGSCIASAPAYQPHCLFSTDTDCHTEMSSVGTTADVYQALTYALSGFMVQSGASDVVLGVSGGIDSALVLAMAADALGAEHCHALMMYTPFTSAESRRDAATLCGALGVSYQEQDIWPLCLSIQQTFATLVDAACTPLMLENLQARLRMLLLMAYTNQHPGTLLLNTSNKSELMMGYGTLYGDLAGAFAVLKDVTKQDVYALAHYRNQCSPVIPAHILSRPPSAELAPGQQDTDRLPPYDRIDAWIARFMTRELSGEEAGDHLFLHHLQSSEFKRFQAPLGPKITHCALGRDWSYPIHTHRFSA